MLLRLENDQIRTYWGDIETALRAAVPPISRSSPAYLSNMMESLLLGVMQAWVLFEYTPEGKAKIYGLAVTSKVVDPGSGYPSLLLYAVYGYTFIPEELWKEGMERLKEFAKGIGCSQLAAYTKVPRIREVAASLGWTTDTTYVTVEV